MLRKKIALISLLSWFAAIGCFAQSDDVSFLLSKINNTYAGRPQPSDRVKFETYTRNVLQEETDTFQILSKIVAYFNDPHLRIFETSGDAVPVDSIEAKKNLEFALKYLSDTSIKKETKEGFYINDRGTSISALVKSQRQPGTYDLVLIEHKSKFVPFGFIIGYISKKHNIYYTEYRNSREGRLYLKTRFRNAQIVIGELTKLTKIARYEPVITLTDYKSPTRMTNGRQMDKDNYLLTLPDFSSEVIPEVDSIIKRDYNKISKSRNLIIDIRDNSGGTVRAFYPVLPFIYTNPILTPSGYTYCSDDLLLQNKEELDHVNKELPRDSSRIKQAQKEVEKVANNLGRFLFEHGDTITLKVQLESPKRVAIIANYATESAAELMILYFKQSKKVTLFGENTAGGVDFLDAYPIELPSKKYILNLATVKRYIPRDETKIDGAGITPQVTIPASIEDWPEYVKAYYEKQG